MITVSDYRKALGLAQHYKAIGEPIIYLDRPDVKKPWSLVSATAAGCMHDRFGACGVDFIAVIDGLEFRWTCDFFRSFDENEKLSIEELRKGLSLLPAARVSEVRTLIRNRANAQRKYVADAKEQLAKFVQQADELDQL